MPTGHYDDHGVLISCSNKAARTINIPISPGLHADVGIADVRQLALNDWAMFTGPGILAFDGDRTIKLGDGETARAKVLRDGPWIVDVERVMRAAAQDNLFENFYTNTGKGSAK